MDDPQVDAETLTVTLFHPRLGKSATAEKGRLETGDLGMSKNSSPEDATTCHNQFVPQRMKLTNSCGFSADPNFQEFSSILEILNLSNAQKL